MLPRFLTICSSSHARSVLSVSWIGANLKGRVAVALTLRRQFRLLIRRRTVDRGRSQGKGGA